MALRDLAVFFNYNINMIMKGEGVTKSNPQYVHFVHTCDAGYFTNINQLSSLTWVMNNHFLRLYIV